MCMLVYLSTDLDLVVPEKSLWHSVELADPTDENSPFGLFTLKNAYYVGSYMDCGCGFLSSNSLPLEEELIDIDPEWTEEWKNKFEGLNAQSHMERDDTVMSTAKLTDVIIRSVNATGTAELWAYECSPTGPMKVDFDINRMKNEQFLVTDGCFYRFYDSRRKKVQLG